MLTQIIETATLPNSTPAQNEQNTNTLPQTHENIKTETSKALSEFIFKIGPNKYMESSAKEDEYFISRKQVCNNTSNTKLTLGDIAVQLAELRDQGIC